MGQYLQQQAWASRPAEQQQEELQVVAQEDQGPAKLLEPNREQARPRTPAEVAQTASGAAQAAEMARRATLGPDQATSGWSRSKDCRSWANWQPLALR